MTKFGIVIASHVPEIAQGVAKLIAQAAKNVPITYAGGTDDNEIGTSFEKIQAAFSDNEGDELLAFYDLGSAKMNLEMVLEMETRKVHLYDVALVEGAYTAAALVEAEVSLAAIEEQLKPLKIK